MRPSLLPSLDYLRNLRLGYRFFGFCLCSFEFPFQYVNDLFRGE